MSASEWESILRDDETVLWQGQPDDGIFLEKSRRKTFFAGLIMFGAGSWMVVSSFGATAATNGKPDFILILFFTVFLAMSGYLALSQLLGPAYTRRHTFYSLSNQRAFFGTAKPNRRRTLETIEIDPYASYEYRPGRLGSIVFEYQTAAVKVNNVPQKFATGFMYVADADKAWAELRKVQAEMITQQSEVTDG